MIQTIQKYYEKDDLSGAVSSVIFLEIREGVTLKAVHVSVGALVSGANAVFALKKNGSAISGAGVTINIGSDEAEVTGLSEALAEDDKLDLALVSGSIVQPVILTLTVDDGVSIDDLLPDQTGNTGKVLKTDGTNAAWEDESGGGGAWQQYDADKPQGSPDAFDDDFEGGSLDGKWTAFGSGDVTTVVADSMLQIKQTSQASYKLAGVYQSLPSGNWSAVAKITHKSGNTSNYAESGIALLETDGATGKIQLFSVYQTNGLKFLEDSVWTNRTTFGSVTSAPGSTVTDSVILGLCSTVYIRLDKSGTNYSTFFSYDGIRWQAANASHAISFTPTKLGVCMYNQGTGGDVTMLVDWIRVYSGVPAYIGGGR